MNTNPNANYVIFEAGRIVYEAESLKDALDFCLKEPNRSIYGRQYVGKPSVKTVQREPAAA